MTSTPSENSAASSTDPVLEVVGHATEVPLQAGMEVTTLRVTLPAGSAGSPPHRHAGPVFGYLIKGALRFEVEGEPERIIGPGESFWEPGGDLIHYQDSNALQDEETEFVVTLVLPPGADLLTPVPAEELAERASRRVGPAAA